MLNILHGRCEELLPEIESGSVDVVLTDPPYQYLKHKLDVPFDEAFVFSEFKRVLKSGGFVVIFGRGTSFYRWNVMLADLGFIFKEEIIWNKCYTTSPVMPIFRKHETIVIASKGKAKIKSTLVPYLEEKRHNIPSLINDIKRLGASLSRSTL